MYQQKTTFIELRARVKRQLVEALQSPTTWRKLWKEYAKNRPNNPTTGKIYSGVNPFILQLQAKSRGYEDNRWIGMGTIKNLGLALKPGEQNKPCCIYFKKIDPIVVNFFGDQKHLFLRSQDSTEQASLILDNVLKYKRQFDPAKVQKLFNKAINSDFRAAEDFLLGLNNTFGTNYLMGKMKSRSKPTVVEIFNFEQLMYDPKLDDIRLKEQTPKFSLNERVEKLVEATKVPVYYDRTDECYYSPDRHEIHMVPRENFYNEHLLYSTLLHELGHATKGMENEKLHRPSHLKNTPGYAFEELCVEMASIFTCAEVGVEYDIANHAGYIQSWITELGQSTPEAVQKLWDALEKAETISNYMLSFDPERKLNRQRQQTIDERSIDPNVIEATIIENIPTPAPEVINETPVFTVTTEANPIPISTEDDFFKITIKDEDVKPPTSEQHIMGEDSDRKVEPKTTVVKPIEDLPSVGQKGINKIPQIKF